MSWYTDPRLFIYGGDHGQFFIFRVTKEFGVNPVGPKDFTNEGYLDFSKHLSLGNNKEGDFDAFKATFVPKSGINKLANSQGLVINWGASVSVQRGSWSREELNSPFWNLPGITDTRPKSVTEQALEQKISCLQDEVNNNKVEKEAQDKRISDLEAENCILKAQVNTERDEKILAGLEALDKKVSDLKAKICCCNNKRSRKSCS